jgi:hypothetical protein
MIKFLILFYYFAHINITIIYLFIYLIDYIIDENKEFLYLILFDKNI